MRRAALKRIACAIAANAEQKPYEHWASQRFPITYEETVEGAPVQIEVDMLELEADYVHILVAVDDGGFSAYFPVSQSVIVRRHPTRQGEG